MGGFFTLCVRNAKPLFKHLSTQKVSANDHPIY
jgi:hypothetical protein